MSGFIVHKLSNEHSTILKSAVVVDYNNETGVAQLKMSEFNLLQNDALPKGNWSVEVGDSAVLAFGYTRAFLLAPNEEVYHKVSSASKSLQWIHPDIFATILSFNGHPTPLKEDFNVLADSASVGILFFYLDKKVYTLDSKSFKILNISDAPIEQKSVELPFYTRVEDIDSAWWGEGSSKLEDYESYYYELMIKFNKENKNLYEIVKNSDKKNRDLLAGFEIKEER